MDNIIIPFDGRKESDIENAGVSVIQFIGFDRLRKILESAPVDLDEDEVIAGFKVDKTGITVIIESK